MLTDRTTYRRVMLAHCLALAQLGEECAIRAADWYENNEPWHFGEIEGRQGLGARVRRELSPKGKA